MLAEWGSSKHFWHQTENLAVDQADPLLRITVVLVADVDAEEGYSAWDLSWFSYIS
jgi:hypothetical protein